MEHFGELLGLVAWPGKEFGAIQVKVPIQEEGGSWWKGNLNGSITKHRFHIRKQILEPTGLPGSQSILLPLLPLTDITKPPALPTGLLHWRARKGGRKWTHWNTGNANRTVRERETSRMVLMLVAYPFLRYYGIKNLLEFSQFIPSGFLPSGCYLKIHFQRFDASYNSHSKASCPIHL